MQFGRERLALLDQRLYLRIREPDSHVPVVVPTGATLRVKQSAPRHAHPQPGRAARRQHLLHQRGLAHLAWARDDLHEAAWLGQPAGQDGGLPAPEVGLGATAHRVEYFYSMTWADQPAARSPRAGSSTARASASETT